MTIPMFVGALSKTFVSKMYMGSSIPWLTDKKPRNMKYKVKFIKILITEDKDKTDLPILFKCNI